MTPEWRDWSSLLSTGLACILAALAAYGLVHRPGAAIQRARAGLDDASSSTRSVRPSGLLDRGRSALRRGVRPRPDAPVRAVRVTSGLGVGAGGALLASAAGVTSPVGLLAVFATGVALGYVILGKIEAPAARRRRHRMIIELPHLLDLTAACLSAGLPLRAAVRAVVGVADGPLADDLGRVIRQVDLGVAEPDAWRSLRGHPVLGRLAVDLARSTESGTMIIDTLRHHARDARRQRRGALEARAKTVGVHSVPPLMVCFLPAFLLIGVVPTGVSAFLHALG